MTVQILPGIALLLLSWAAPAGAQQDASAPPQEPGWNYDPENARDILEVCAACHGRNGEGGKDGEYPRIAGQHTNYLRRQIEHFRSGERLNEDMEDVFERFGEDDMEDIFAYLASVDD